MLHPGSIVRVLSCFLFLVAACGGADKQGSGSERRSDLAAGSCGLNQTAFCDSFDAPAGTGNRAGQLDGTVWGVSRVIGGGANLGQGMYNAWGTTQLQTCSGATTTTQPERDVIICNGQLREAVNDLHDVTTLAMYPKQPFDFAGRTGVIAFDVSNDTLGIHTEWPELWITDQPVPSPFTFQNSWLSAPRHGFGLRFSAATTPFQGRNIAPACPNDAHERWSVASGVAIRNYVIDDQEAAGAFKVTMLDCVIGASGPGHMNHVEVHVSQSQIDVYATDADTLAPLHHIAVVQNANLTFTRGLVWIEDVHYNAEKFGGQTQHTFSWDNVGFDGPVLPRDLAFDASDSLQPVANYPGLLNLGWYAPPGSGHGFSIAGVSGIANAAAAVLTFNFHHATTPQTISYVVNGHAHSTPWPYPERQAATWRTLAVPVPLAEIAAGTNTVNIFADQDLVVANVDLILVGAGGVGGGGGGGTDGGPGGGTDGGPGGGTDGGPPPSQTLTFDDTGRAINQPFSGGYPAGIIDWGTNQWLLSGPFGQFPTDSLTFNGDAISAAPLTLLGATHLVQFDVNNAGPRPTNMQVSCAGQPSVQVALPSGLVTTARTGWTQACSPVTISVGNGWDTGIDNLVISQ